MDTALLKRIEADINQLSTSDQLWLVERLAQRLRQQTQRTRPPLKSELAAMAQDPAIQRELRLIEAEFAGTEADGLGDEV